MAQIGDIKLPKKEDVEFDKLWDALTAIHKSMISNKSTGKFGNREKLESLEQDMIEQFSSLWPALTAEQRKEAVKAKRDNGLLQNTINEITIKGRDG